MQMKHFLFIMALFSICVSAKPLNDPNSWVGVTDQVMGGISDLEISYSDGIFFMIGNVSTDNNGGFVRLSNRVDIQSNDFKGIKFKAKGNSEIYEIHVTLKGFKIPPWSYFSKAFKVKNSWQNYEIFFKDLKKATGYSAASMKAKNIKDISIAGYGRDFDVNLQIKDIFLIPQ